MRKLIFGLFILFILILPGAALAQESGDGIINGQVINATENGGEVVGLPVNLITYLDDDMQLVAATETDEDGKFHFDNLNREYKYLVSVSYMEVDYYYPVVFSMDETQEFVEAAVCDSTGNDRDIRVVVAHKIISLESTSMNITEMFVLLNEGDHTYIGDETAVVDSEQGVLVFTLPDAAVGFQAPPELAGDLILSSQNKVNYDVPFPPGELQIFYNYQVPLIDAEEIDIEFPVDYYTDYVDIMVKSGEVEVATAQLAPAEPVETASGDRYIHFTGQNISRDDSIGIQFYRQRDSSAFILVVTIIIIACLALLIAGILYWMKRKKSLDVIGKNNDINKNE